MQLYLKCPKGYAVRAFNNVQTEVANYTQLTGKQRIKTINTWDTPSLYFWYTTMVKNQSAGNGTFCTIHSHTSSKARLDLPRKGGRGYRRSVPQARSGPMMIFSLENNGSFPCNLNVEFRSKTGLNVKPR